MTPRPDDREPMQESHPLMLLRQAILDLPHSFAGADTIVSRDAVIRKIDAFPPQTAALDYIAAHVATDQYEWPRWHNELPGECEQFRMHLHRPGFIVWERAEL